MIGSASAARHVVSKGAALRECGTRIAIARRIARLGYEFASEHDASLRYSIPLYFLPDDNLLRSIRSRLGSPMKQTSSSASCRIVSLRAITHAAVDPSSRVISRALERPYDFYRTRNVPHESATPMHAKCFGG